MEALEVTGALADLDVQLGAQFPELGSEVRAAVAASGPEVAQPLKVKQHRLQQFGRPGPFGRAGRGEVDPSTSPSVSSSRKRLRPLVFFVSS